MCATIIKLMLKAAWNFVFEFRAVMIDAHISCELLHLTHYD